MTENNYDDEVFDEDRWQCSQEEFDEQVDRIASVLRYLVPGYPVFEIRALGERQIAGYFNDPVEAAQQAAFLDQYGYSVYFGLNPTSSLTAPCADRFNEVGPGKALRDDQILGRRLLLVDLDPVRPAGVCSTETEKAAAKAVADEIVDYLRQQGWPDPIRADSGNGAHLIYRVDLPPDDEGLVHRVLVALAGRFNTTAVKIDTAVGNASRICRLYGTHNRKGPDTPDRPHRLAQILSVPGKFEAVPRELLEHVAATVRVEPAHSSNTAKANAVVAAVPPVIPQQTADEALIARARAKLHTLPIAVEGQNGSKRCFHAACVLVVDFGLSVQQAFPLLKEYSTRCQPPWSDQELLHKLEDAAKKALEKPEEVGQAAPSREKGKSAAERLMDIVGARISLWHDADTREAYATIAMPSSPASDPSASHPAGWHKQNHRVYATSFTEILRHIDFSAHGRVVAAQALREAVETCASIAKFERPGHKVHLRVARVSDAVYLDLGTPQWNAIEIDGLGWRMVGEPPCKFRRSQGMLPLPIPERGGTIADFQELFKLDSTADMMLLVGWLVMALHGIGPFPAQNLVGEQGSAKTTMAEMIRSLVDPAKPGMRPLTKDDRDLMIAAENSWIVAFDNLSGIDAATSDALCRLATGGGYSTRKLYTDSEEALFDACRPIILTGINEVTTRADLLDRSQVIQIPILSEENRRTAQEVKERYATLRPRLLGLLLDGVACALANYRSLKLDARLRMADYQQWAAAAMPAFGWTAEQFLEAYAHNIDVAHGIALEDSPVTPALRMLLKSRGGRWPNSGEIKGAQALLVDLESLPGTNFKGQKGWPQRGNTLGQILRRLAPVLRRSGVQVTFDQRQTGSARITPLQIETASPQTTSSPSPSPSPQPADTEFQAPPVPAQQPQELRPSNNWRTEKWPLETDEDLERFLEEAADPKFRPPSPR